MEEQDGQLTRRRLVGIDLGIASRHSVRVLEADGQVMGRSSCVPTVESLSAVEQAALAGAPEGTRLAVVFEPTGPAWMPIAVFFARRGHAVYRVSSAKAADLRRFLRRHAKTNGIDAETLARMPLADPQGLQRLELPGPDAAALDRRVRACGRLTEAASKHKVRICGKTTILRLIEADLVAQLLPDGQQVLVVPTDPWRYDPSVGAKETLIGEVLGALGSQIKETEGATGKARKLLTKLKNRVDWSKAIPVAAGQLDLNFLPAG